MAVVRAEVKVGQVAFNSPLTPVVYIYSAAFRVSSGLIRKSGAETY